MKPTVYAKKSCITCQKALAWLDTQGLEYELHAIEKDPPAKAVLESALSAYAPTDCLNSRSAIYKSEGLNKELPDPEQLIALMQQDPNLIKRPVILKDPKAVPYLGFDAASLAQYLGV